VVTIEPIVISPNDLWQVIVAVCGGIIALSGAGAVITGIVHKAKAPNVKQNQRLDAIEEDIKKINERLDADNGRFADDADRIDELEQTMKFTTKLIIESLQALTSHAIDGNNIEQLKKADDSLNNYLLNGIMR
jgi:septal ring factor EnvC (AmiA/AmiB activator)